MTRLHAPPLIVLVPALIVNCLEPAFELSHFALGTLGVTFSTSTVTVADAVASSSVPSTMRVPATCPKPT